jgi:hypothetical protein
MTSAGTATDQMPAGDDARLPERVPVPAQPLPAKILNSLTPAQLRA